MKTILTLTQSQFRAITCSDDPKREHLVYSFGGVSDYKETQEFVLRDQRIFSSSEYLHRSAGGVLLDHESLWEVWSTAKDYHVLASSHTHMGSAFFSSIDNTQDYRVVQNVLDFSPHYLRLVSGCDGIVAEVFSRDNPSWRPLDGIKVVSPSGIQFLSPKNAANQLWPSTVDEKTHDRTLRLGPGARTALETLHNAVLGIVGAGGGSSILVQMLKCYQPRKIILVDPDLLEIHNANRFLGYRPGDEGNLKVKVLEREIHAFSPEIEVMCVTEYFPQGDSVEALKEADILLSFPDNNATRYKLALFAVRYHKPVFDAGTLVSYHGKKDPQRITARILAQLPEGPCLKCLRVNGGYSPDIIEQTRKSQASYSDNPELQPVPQVVTTNAFAASLLIRNLMCWLYPKLVERIPTYLQYDELTPTIEDLSSLFPCKSDCPLCGEAFEAERGWGDASPVRDLFIQPQESCYENSMMSL